MRTMMKATRTGRSAPARRLAHRATLAAAIAFAIVIAAASVAMAASYNVWTTQTSGTTQTLYGVAFPTATQGWAVGGNGTIRHTTNGGSTWTAQTSGTTRTLYGVAFPNTSNGWAVGSNGTIRVTTNGGATWTGQTSGTTRTLYSVAFATATNGWVTGSNGTIRVTTNGGATWTGQTSGTTQTLYGVAFATATRGWVVGSGGIVRVTANGGTTWTGQTSGTTRTLYGVTFTDTSNGWATGTNGVIIHTANGGTNWAAQTSGVTATLYGIAPMNTTLLWTVGSGGAIRTTTNGGTTWSAQTSGTTQTLRAIVYSSGELWTVGGGGVIRTYLIDVIPPATTATGVQADNHSGWIKTSQQVTLAATDSQSGVAATYYTVDGGARQTYSSPFTVSGSGSHTVTYWSVDNGGTTEATHTGYVNIDPNAPTTTATGLQLDAHSGWRSTSQSVTLSATDGAGSVSGVASTWYTVDTGAPVLYTGAPFTVSGDGSHAVTYFSTDVAGNVEATHTGFVNIDSIAPTTTGNGLQADNHSGWRATSQTVSLIGDDGAGSGVATTYYTLDGGGGQVYAGPFTVSGQGTHFVTYWSVDAVGNAELSHTGWVNIDTTVPTVGDDADANWHHTPPAIHLTPADTGGSGMAATQYRAQGSSTWLDAAGNAFTVPAPADGSNDGARVYQYRAVDNAGNASVTHSCTVWIDATPPVTMATGLQPDMFSGWRTTSQDVDLSADDGAGSGVTATYYTVDGGGTQTFAGTFTVSGYGQHAVTYWSTDVAGNVEPVRTGYVNISSPFAQATGLSPDDHSGWRDTPADVTIGADGDHQPLTIHYRVGGGSWQTAANPAAFTVAGEGSHPVDYYATNTVNVESIHENGYANIDLTAPVTAASGLQPSATTGWQTSSQLVSLTPSDALSGVAATYFTVDGGGAHLFTGAPFTVSGNGSHAVTYWSIDAAGNAETANAGFVNIDLAAPATTAGGLQADDHSGWRTTAQTVSLTADDAGGSGVAHVYYTVDGGGTQTYGGAFSVSGEATHVVTYWAVDDVGNTEAVNTGYVNIDATAPTTSASGLQSDDHSGWRSADQVVTLTPGDTVSGVAHTYYTVDGGGAQTYTAPFTVSGERQHVVTYWSVDAAGNAETPRTGYVNIDLTAPATTATGLQANGHSGWRTTAQTVSLNAGDGSSGSGVAQTYYTVDGGGTQTYGGSFQVSGEGTHTVTYWSVDTVGNAEAVNTGFVNIDTTAPTTTAAELQPNATTGWRNTSQVVTLTPDDGSGSGVGSTHYTAGGGTLTYTAPFTVSGQGSHVITYWSTDAVGNTEVVNTGYVNIDLTVPTVSDDADGAWHDTPVPVTLTPADTGGSGVAGTQYRLQGSSTWLDTTGNVFTVPAPADGSNDGAHVYEYRALDNAGSASSTHTCTVKIDTQGPAVTPTGLQPDSHSGWTTTPQLIRLTADDNGGSGTQTIYYTVDGGGQQTYSAPFTVSGLGSHWVVYWSVDNLGNVSAQNTGYVNIDDPWALASGLADDDHSHWRNTSPTVTITGGGDFPPFTIHYRIDGGGWAALASVATLPAISAEGSHPVDYYAVNNNGQQSAVTQTGYVNIDKTAPATTATGLQANATTGWIATSQDVTFGATDARSGVATTYYTVDGGAAQVYSGTPVTVSGKDSHAVTYWSVDAAGNAEAAHTGYVNIDLTPPVTGATNLADDDHSGWTGAAMTVTLTPSDTQSGTAATYYTVDGGDQTTYAGAFTVSGEGQHQVTYWSVDNLGNVEDANTGYVNIDSTAPTTTADGVQATNNAGWQSGDTTVTLAADDASGSGVSATSYTVDGSGTQTYSAPFTVSGQGSHPVTWWSVDVAGNTEATHTGYVNIDTTAPTVTDNGDGLWHRTAVTVQLTPADTGGSGVAETGYRPQGSSTWLPTAGNSFVVPAPVDGANDGAHFFEYRALDNAGNQTVGTCTVRIDTTAPSTGADGLQPNGYTGWVNAAQQVTLTPDDGAGSGDSVTRYTLDGGGTQTYSAPFTVSGQGSHPVTWWSVDAAGNTEATHTGYVNIDTTLPTVSDNAPAGWQNGPVTVQLTPADSGGSGVAATQYREQGSSTWLDTDGDAFDVPAPSDGSNDGVHAFEYRALDNAGNASTTGSCTVRIDTTAPVTTASGLQADNHSGWLSAAQTVTIAPDDASGSGVATTYYTIDGGTRQTYAAPFVVSGEGRHRVRYWSVDNVGNVQTPVTGYVNIDLSAPLSSASGLAADQTAWVNVAQTVTLSASDSLSGVAHTYYAIDGGAQQTYAAPFTIAIDGQYAIGYWSVDNVGNAEPARTGYVNLDTTAPVTTASGLQPDGHSGWQTTDQDVTLTPDDGSGSGVIGTWYTLDGGSAQPYIGTFTVSGTGQHAVTWWSADLAGNTEATHTGYVNISNPYAQATGLANDDHSGWINTSGTVTIAGGGDFPPYTIHYWLDGSGQTVGSPASFAVSGEGSHQVDYFATNSMDQESLHQTGYVNIDLTEPVTGAGGLQGNATTGWRNASQVVTLDPTDNLSGVAHTYYTLDGGGQQMYAAPFTVSGEASHVVTWWSVDAAGNTETAHTGYVNIDVTLPTVSDDAPSGWQNAPVLVQLTAGDSGGSLLAGTQYRVAGDPTWSATTADAFTVAAPSNGSNDGVHDFDYRALDNAGNASTTGACAVRVDTQAPVVVNDADAYWHNAAVTVHLTAADPRSGVKQVAYRLQGTSTWTVVTGATADVDVPSPADGLAHSYVYEYTATDVAGNTDAVATMTVNMDPRMPNTTIHGLPGTGWANAAVSITFTATPGDGAPIARTEYSFDGGGTWTTWNGSPVVVSTLGPTTITYRSVNAAGTVENPARVSTFGIDTSRPTCLAYKNASVKRGRTVTLYYKVKDPLPASGFAKVTIDIRGKYKLAKRITVAKAKVNAKLTVKVKIKLKKGTYFWKVKATDLAGNIQMKSSGATKKLYVK